VAQKPVGAVVWTAAGLGALVWARAPAGKVSQEKEINRKAAGRIKWRI
jgi:hypothetical protein